jgi:hypothetical protein
MITLQYGKQDDALGKESYTREGRKGMKDGKFGISSSSLFVTSRSLDLILC